MRLEDHKDRQPFSTPEGSFPELNRKIAASTANAPAKKQFRIGIFVRWASIAAAVAILLTVAVNITGTDSNIPTLNPTEPSVTDTQLIAVSNTAGNVSNSAELLPEEHDLNADEYSNEYYEALIDNYTINEYTFYCYLTDTDFE